MLLRVGKVWDRACLGMVWCLGGNGGMFRDVNRGFGEDEEGEGREGC